MHSSHIDQFFSNGDANFCEDFLYLKKVDVNCVHPASGWTKLHQACSCDNIEVVKVLLKYNVDQTIKTTNLQQTAAMLTNDIEIIKLLIKTIDEVDKDGDTVLHYLDRRKNYNAIDTLIAMGVKCDIFELKI
jgi:ankyrin repeat protein